MPAISMGASWASFAANRVFEGPMILEIFVKDGRLTCADVERGRRRPNPEIDEEMGFRGNVIGLRGPRKALDCGDMLIALND